jgi:hypothetical protein
MAELKRSQFESDFADANYSNQRLAGGVYVGTKGAGLDWFATLVDMLASIDDRLLPLAGLRVYKNDADGDLQFSVTAGSFVYHGAVVYFAGAIAQSLTDAAANYVYLTAAGTLAVNTTGWPADGHVSLAVITPAGGAFDDPTQIVDHRQVYPVVGPPPQLQVSIDVGSESSNTIAVTLQVTDAAGNDVADVFSFPIVLSDSDGVLSETGTACTSWTATTGAINDGIFGCTAGKSAWVTTDAAGTAVIEIEYTGGAKTWYLLTLLQHVPASQELTFTA